MEGEKIVCKYRGDLDSKRVNIPSSIEQIILSRLDKLSPNQQMLLKVRLIFRLPEIEIGSCVGMDVNPKLLKDIAPKTVEESDEKILEVSFHVQGAKSS